MNSLYETYLMILNYTNISCMDVLRGRWFSTKFSCDFFDFLLRALRLAYENQLRKLVHLPGRSAQQASQKVGKQRIRRTGRGAWGADFILRPFAATKSASKSPSMHCCVSLLFVMFPAAVFS